MRTVEAIRYVAPLRQGGSLPALVEADDDGLYVVKLRGAGQGPRALVAEFLVGELGRALGLRVPELVVADLDPHIADAEPDPEIQDLLQASAGANAGLDFLPGSLMYLPGCGLDVPAEEAAAVVWLDALTENVDRTPRNTNLLVWHGQLWLIDHGAALYRQHAGLNPDAAGGVFAAIGEHVLLPHAASIADADERLAPIVDRTLLESLTANVPPDWFQGAAAETYVEYLLAPWPGLGAGSLTQRRRGQVAESFQYALLRVVPSLPRGEAMNVAIVLHCRRCGFLGVRSRVDDERLRVLDPSIDIEAVKAHMELLERVAAGKADNPIAELDRSERFGWIVAPSSTVVQPSDVHTGLTDDPAATIEKLFASLVAVPER